MSKEISQKQIAANQANAKKSTGPKTAAGRDASKFNALKHGILSKAVLVRGTNLQESHQEYMELQERFRRELQPLGPLEEMLVDQIVTTHWRLRRVLAAEAGEIALSVDGGQWERSKSVEPQWFGGRMRDDPVSEMEPSALGNATDHSAKRTHFWDLISCRPETKSPEPHIPKVPRINEFGARNAKRGLGYGGEEGEMKEAFYQTNPFFLFDKPGLAPPCHNLTATKALGWFNSPIKNRPGRSGLLCLVPPEVVDFQLIRVLRFFILTLN